MKLGVCIPNYGETCSKEAVREIAVQAEKLGIDSVWCTDHILMQHASGTPYEKIFDSITTLAFLAGVTSRVKLGISSLITAMRNPVVVAKQLATVDVLSSGRLILATSAGWNENEFRNLNSDFHTRGKRLNESIRLMRTLWEGETTAFTSKFLNTHFEGVVFEPRPIQKHIPIWIAGNSPAAMKRAVKYGDGWHPNMFPLDTFHKMIETFRSEFPDARNKQVSVRIGLNPRVETSEYRSPQGERRLILSSNRMENREILGTLKDLGVMHVVAALSPDGKANVNDQILGMKILMEDSR